MKKIHSLFYLLLLQSTLFSYGIPAQVSRAVKPSKIDMNTNYITPYTQSYKLTYIKDGKEIKSVVMHDKVIWHEKQNDEKYILRIQSIPENNFVDSSINVHKNLKPFYLSSHTKGGNMFLHFGNDVVTGKRYFSMNDSLVVINTKMPVPYFDSNIIELVIRSLPLDNSFKARIPTYVFEDGGISWFDISVDGEEMYQCPNGTKEAAWVINVLNNEKTMRLWVAKKNHDLLKISAQIKAGFEVIEEKM